MCRSAKELGWKVGGPLGSAENAFYGQGAEWKRLRMFMQTDMLAPAAAKGYSASILKAADLASKEVPISGHDMNT